MAPRRRSRRPWYRTRAYRLTRTVVVVVALVVGGVRWAGDDEPAGPVVAAGAELADPAVAGRLAGGTNSRRAGGDERGAKPRRLPPARPVRPAPPPKPLPRSPATSLRIPYFGLEAPIVGLRLDRERRLAAPPVNNPKLVGWYEGGPTPGESGTAVAVGHRDTRTGPAVFVALGQLRPGRLVEVRRADGRTAVYTVDAVKTYEKAHFPDKEVYGDRGRPELRLITCGGVYDRKRGYAGNVVVFAHLTETRRRADTR
ncbi:class F sortase [Streptomyces sp. NPDC050564]|uniref:class F sortase n=1 Tax=Streptomyces sp. NPDC050564 TaxID=3365631 RepID=UPI00379A86F6